MKNKIISISVIAALAAGAITGAHMTSYAEDLPTGKVEHKKPDEVTTEFDPSSGTVAGGSYYLTNDVSSTKQIKYNTTTIYGQGKIFKYNRKVGKMITPSDTDVDVKFYDMIFDGSDYTATVNDNSPFLFDSKNAKWTFENCTIQNYNTGVNAAMDIGNSSNNIALNLINFTIADSNKAKYSIQIGNTGKGDITLTGKLSIPSVYINAVNSNNTGTTRTIKIEPAAGSTVGITSDNVYYINTDETNLSNPVFKTSSDSNLLERFICLDRGYKLVVNNKAVYKVTLPELAISVSDNKLTGFTVGEKYTVSYTVDEKTTSTEITPTGTACDIDDAWYGKTISIIKNGNGSYIADSRPQELTIPPQSISSATATATLTKSDSSTTGIVSVTAGDEAISKITLNVNGTTIMEYPADGRIEAGETVNLSFYVEDIIDESAIELLADGDKVKIQ